MKISRIEGIPVRYHLDFPNYEGKWKNPLPYNYDAVIVRVHTDDGFVGVGEAPAFTRYLGDTKEHILRALDVIADSLLGKDPFKIEEAHAAMDKLFRYHGGKSVNNAIDNALYDLVGKARGLPVYDLIGGGLRTEFQLLGHVYYRETELMVDHALRLVKQGYTALEIKAKGVSMSSNREDIRRMRAILEAVGDEIFLIWDFNQTWLNPKTVISEMNKEFRGVSNLAIEQPINYLNIEGMAQIARAIDLPLSADEAAFSPEAVMHLVQRQAADILNLKLARVGGIYKALKIIAIAEAAGLRVRFDFLPYSQIGDSATAHVASVVADPAIPLAADGFTLVRENPVRVNGVTLEPDCARLSERAGLGFELNEEVIEQIRVR